MFDLEDATLAEWDDIRNGVRFSERHPSIDLVLTRAWAPWALYKKVETTYDFFAGNDTGPADISDRGGVGHSGGGPARGSRGGTQAAPGTAPRGGTYLHRDPVTQQVLRTGRSKNLARREREHARDPVLNKHEFEIVDRTDVYREQRGLEQMLHDKYSPHSTAFAQSAR